MEQVLDRVRQLSSSTDAAARKKLTVMLRDLAYSMEEANDTIDRISYMVESLFPRGLFS